MGWEDPLKEGMAITTMFLPGESHGQRSLVGYSLWGRKESDTTERLHFHFSGNILGGSVHRQLEKLENLQK